MGRTEPGATLPGATVSGLRRAGWVALAIGGPALVVAAALAPGSVEAATAQDWPPFVLVAGLLVVGLVASDDGLFDAAGNVVADVSRGGRSLFLAAAVLIALVTAVLNLDTAVALCTPVVVLAARRQATPEAPFCYLAVFLANGASLLLTGSNLTNLIVLGTVHRSGGSFAAHMALPWAASVATVTAVVGARWWRALGRSAPSTRPTPGMRVGAGLAGVAVAVAAMIALPPPAAAGVVAGAGASALAWKAARGHVSVRAAEHAVNAPVLAGLFCVAADLGTLGRVWSWPHHLLAHASMLASASAGALASVAVNNLPAASLLSARAPAHPLALLIGLDLGPNLAVTGALSAVLWLQVCHQVGTDASVARYSRLGVVVAVASMAAALAVLAGAG